MQGVDLVVYEKDDDVGGTWYENRYVNKAYGLHSFIPPTGTRDVLVIFRHIIISLHGLLIRLGSNCESISLRGSPRVN